MSKQEGENKWTEREGKGELDMVCMFLYVAFSALMDPAATGLSQGNLGFSCFDYVKIDSSLQIPDLICPKWLYLQSDAVMLNGG